ncbi:MULTISPECIES: hypothetical protein [unclassified Leclercia]|uniref:Uncharacterized protein n=1 Tax=Leclercia barmai TaxID=2785629 RepID=A0ABS7RZX1_9ENTR|nr:MULTISPECIES: hypothetical protein [unclassified Leclercia]MBZ0059602.1 hypothetical protein [Leclercia sp. EMC7]MCM5697265.1 hypothetical protein [Leclercia sp. LTM01]MCM5702139.1 hypothetical protein [Leclercia sp. LTM14]
MSIKPTIKQTVLAVVLLISTGAHAHQYTEQIVSWTTRLKSAEKTIRDVQCSLNDLDHLTTCKPANTAQAVARLLATIKPDASDADAREMFKIADKVMSLTDDEEDYKRMYAELTPENSTPMKEAALNRGLNELMRLSYELGSTSLGEE